MKGFPERFADLPDYILKITEEIWEGPAVRHAARLLRARHRHAVHRRDRPGAMAA